MPPVLRGGLSPGSTVRGACMLTEQSIFSYALVKHMASVERTKKMCLTLDTNIGKANRPQMMQTNNKEHGGRLGWGFTDAGDGSKPCTSKPSSPTNEHLVLFDASRTLLNILEA